jgi:hypothetical protein
MRRVRARPIPPKVLVATAILIALVGVGYWRWQARQHPLINSYETCIAAGNPVLESYPEQCVYQGQSFINPNQNIPKPY